MGRTVSKIAHLMLAIEVEFLTGRYYASAHHDPEATEWPPHPARLFSALVATWYEAHGSAEEKEALHWLESQMPPEIAASSFSERPAPKVFVPANDKRLGKPQQASKPLPWYLLPENRGRRERYFPSGTPADPVVRYAWSRAEPSPKVAAALAKLAAKVASLGHSASLVRVAVGNSLIDARFVPDEDGNCILRTTTEGQLEALDEAFQIHRGVRQRTLPASFTAYRDQHAETAAPELPRSVFDERWIVLRPKRRLTLRAALPFCLALRDALMKRGPQPLPEWLSGHESGGQPSQRPHVAFVPLADVGHVHAHGLILGFAVILPREASEAARAQCSAACRGISRLTCGRAGDCEVELLTGCPDRAALAPFTWSRPASIWASATPFVFDRDPKKDLFGPVAEGIVRQACLRVGFPEPAAVSVTPVSQLLAVPMSAEFPARDLPGKQRRRHAHVQITFAEKVRGPVLIGAGRYYGYGLLRPLPKAGEPAMET